jgi:hypothetical protein
VMSGEIPQYPAKWSVKDRGRSSPRANQVSELDGRRRLKG